MNFDFDYCAPQTETELLDLLATTKDAVLLAGGTDLIVNMRSGLKKPTTVVNFKKIAQCHQLEFDAKKGLVIGAGVTVNNLLENKVVKEKFPVLAEACHLLASHQLRNRATVIGNIVNASPSGDLPPVFLCLDASIKLVSKKGERVVSLKDFFLGVKKTVITKDEWAKEVIVPAASADAKGDYKKLTRIKGHDLSLLGVAVVKGKGFLAVSVNAAAPTPVLVGRYAADVSMETVLSDILAKISPIDDIRCSKKYRLFMAQKYAKDIMKELAL